MQQGKKTTFGPGPLAVLLVLTLAGPAMSCRKKPDNRPPTASAVAPVMVTDQADSHFLAGDYERAVPAYQQALAVVPDASRQTPLLLVRLGI